MNLMTKPTVQQIEQLFYNSYYDENEHDYKYDKDIVFQEVTRQFAAGGGEDTQYLFVVRDIRDNKHWGVYLYHDSWHEEPLSGRIKPDAIFPVKAVEVTITQWVQDV